MTIEAARAVGLELTDIQRRAGQWIGGGELREPATALDIRRWVQAMDYANPLHWDDDYALNSPFGGIVAPQSFVLAMDCGHSGMPTAIVGYMPDAHMIVGSEEWWYSGYRIRPGDKVNQKRRFDGFDIKDTAFAGPTVFSRGDTFHTTSGGTPVAHCRTTALRYSAEEADKRSVYGKGSAEKKQWSQDELDEVARIRYHWILSNREGNTPRIGDLKVGDKLPRRAIGPHSIASFSSEWRAFPFQTWGAFRWVRPEGIEDPWVDNDPGTVKGMALNREGAKIDPRLEDGLYSGPAAAHVDPEKASQIGMGSRAFGYGASLSAWFADYLEYWAGHNGRLRHSKLMIKSPALEGDATLIDGEIVNMEPLSPLLGIPLVMINVELTNQEGTVLVSGTAEVEVDF